jgi:hypothetical protein
MYLVINPPVVPRQDVKDVVLAVLKRNPPPLPAVHREHAGWRLAARAHSA